MCYLRWNDESHSNHTQVIKTKMIESLQIKEHNMNQIGKLSVVTLNLEIWPLSLLNFKCNGP